MNKVGGHRNFGYGKRMAWAGKQAIRDRYGDGRYATFAAHAERWKVFSAWCQEVFGIRDARQIDRSVIETYGQTLSTHIKNDRLSVAYAQNLLSTVNVVLESMRGDRRVRIAPAATVGERSTVRSTAPAGVDREMVRQCAEHIRSTGHERVASAVELARELGLRLREASMLDARLALHQARTLGAVNITAGTKGARGSSRRSLGASVSNGDGLFSPGCRPAGGRSQSHSTGALMAAMELASASRLVGGPRQLRS